MACRDGDYKQFFSENTITFQQGQICRMMEFENLVEKFKYFNNF